MHSLGIAQWNFTRRDHSGNPRRVSELGLVSYGAATQAIWLKNFISRLLVVDSISRPIKIFCDNNLLCSFQRTITVQKVQSTSS